MWPSTTPCAICSRASCRPPSPRRLAGSRRRGPNDRDHAERDGIALAEAVGEWGEVGGYYEEARWDACCDRVLRQPLDEAASRPVTQLSGGERKRLVLESLLSSEIDILLLDEPDNFLDLSGKRWLERTDPRVGQDHPARQPRSRVPRCGRPTRW